MSVPIQPLSHFVVAQEPEKNKTTAAGIFLPGNAQERIKVYKVVAVGANVDTVKVGDNIVFKSYSQTDIKIENVDYAIIADEDIIATVQQ